MKTARRHKIVFTALLFTIFLSACTDSGQSISTEPPPPAPSELSGGEKLFNNNCAGCHGIGAVGTDRGPTFISKIYEPNHHADPTFHMAVKNGVRQHHWDFGNMPKISGVAKEEVDQIIAYVRWLQRENGIR